MTVIVAQLIWRGWVSGTRALLRCEWLFRSLAAPTSPELAPVAADLCSRLRDLEDEYRRSRRPSSSWSPQRLQSLLGSLLSGDQVIVVSSREAYLHERTPGGLVVRRPAIGLVTGVDPVLPACSGRGSALQ